SSPPFRTRRAPSSQRMNERTLASSLLWRPLAIHRLAPALSQRIRHRLHRVGAGEPRLCQDLVEQRRVGSVGPPLADPAVAEAAGTVHRAGLAAQQAAGIEDADVRDLFQRFDGLGQRLRDDADALARQLVFDNLRAQLVARLVERLLARRLGLAHLANTL